MKHIYRLQKTDSICDIDQVLSVLRTVSGVVSAMLLEGAPRVVIESDTDVPMDVLNKALAAKVSCRLENGQIQSE